MSVLDSEALDHARRTHFRLVRTRDAEFILSLRTDKELSEYLSDVDADVETQRRWIGRYIEREQRGEEYYFIIIHENAPVGTIRLYDCINDNDISSFSWGSWVIKKPRPKGVAKVSLCLLYKIGFDTLKYDRSHFEAMLENDRAISLYERTGATRLNDVDGFAKFHFWPKDMAQLFKCNAQTLADHGYSVW